MSLQSGKLENLTVVVGAAGTVGVEIVHALAAEGSVRGLVRRPSVRVDLPNVTYAMANHESVDEMSRAMYGAQSLVISIGTSPQMVDVEQVAIKAASNAGISKVVKISAPKVKNVSVSQWHQQSEEHLAQSGIDYVIIRPTAFMQNWLRNADPIKFTKQIVGSACDGARNYVDVRDVANVAAMASKQTVPNHVINVEGPEALSNHDIAKRLSSVLGRTISYLNLSSANYRSILTKKAGLPVWLVEHLIELEELARDHPETGSDVVKQLTGKVPRTFDEFIYENRLAFQHRTYWPF